MSDFFADHMLSLRDYVERGGVIVATIVALEGVVPRLHFVRPTGSAPPKYIEVKVTRVFGTPAMDDAPTFELHDIHQARSTGFSYFPGMRFDELRIGQSVLVLESGGAYAFMEATDDVLSTCESLFAR